MQFHKTPLRGAYVIDLDKREDERGFFARFYCTSEFAKLGLESDFIQVNNSLSVKQGTLRGLHYQVAPREEAKLVRCIRGALWDVILDLRPDSETFGKWYGQELTADNRRMMYVPKGFGHGFVTLEDNTEALYMVSEVYSSTHERGIRWNDPRFKIEWPFQPIVISDKDKEHPNFNSG